MKYLIANLKEHQNQGEAVTWINKFVNTLHASPQIIQSLKDGRLGVVLAPSSPFLVIFRQAVHEFTNIWVAAQDVSIFPSGSYTGEVGSHTLEGIVTFCVVGHSERRRNFGETGDLVRKKIQNLLQVGILPIVCFSGVEEVSTVDRGMIAYEPPDAIGSGKNYPVEAVLEFKRQLGVATNVPFLYGGSADEQNMRLYLHSDEIAGLLVGTASRDASQFCEMLKLV